MKLLYDHNLSPRLVRRLHDLFPESMHVLDVGLEQALDTVVWEYAAAHHFTITTKDSDFSDLSVLRGTPPKVIWIQIGNATTDAIEAILRKHAITIYSFLTDPITGLITLA
jgi:predicted nuclease of predicted toxin-antitoxin system